MIVKISAIACVIATTALCGAASTDPAIAPATSPASAASSTVAAPVQSLPDILLNRSIFSREQRRSQRVRTYQPRPEPPRVVRVPSPIFTGAIYDQTEYVAFLEDPDSGKVGIVHAGQTLPQGRIESITLDYLMLQPADGGTTRRVDLGHNLAGELRSIASDAATPAPASPTPAATASPTTATADTTPAAPDGNAATPAPPADSGGTDSIVEKMRRRRLQETQGN